LQVIERFLNKVQTESIRAEEKEKGIVWSFVEHFFKWGDSGIAELEALSLFALAALSYLGTVIGFFSITIFFIISKKGNRKFKLSERVQRTINAVL
jgi:hypothetical protein